MSSRAPATGKAVRINGGRTNRREWPELRSSPSRSMRRLMLFCLYQHNFLSRRDQKAGARRVGRRLPKTLDKRGGHAEISFASPATFSGWNEQRSVGGIPIVDLDRARVDMRLDSSKISARGPMERMICGSRPRGALDRP